MRNTAIVLVIFMLFSACDRRPKQQDVVLDHNTMDHSKMDHSAMESSPNAASAPYELQFIDTMIVHHQGAIDMAQLVQTRAQHPELKKLAADIIEAQQKEIEQMRSWRSEGFSGAAPAINMDIPGMHDGMKGMDLAKLDLLKENAFDLEFIRQMIPHHEGAVVMANDAIARLGAQSIAAVGIRADLLSLAREIVDAQEGEINQMKDWQAQWENAR